MISRKIISTSLFKSSSLAYNSFYHQPFVASPFNFNFNFNFNSVDGIDSTHQIRHYSSKPRFFFDFGRIRKPDDAVALFRQMQSAQPLPSVIDFMKLLSSVVKIRQYDVALFPIQQNASKGSSCGHELSKSTGNAGGRIACGIIGLQG